MKLKTKQYQAPDNNDPMRRYSIQKAASLHQRAHPSDPFAASRVTLHMMQGYELPSDIISEAEMKLKARGQQIEYLG